MVCSVAFVILDIETREILLFEPRPKKTNNLVSDLVLHKPGCTASEDG